MQKWEYMWIYVDDSVGKRVYVANGERLEAQTYTEALNIVGKGGLGAGRCGSPDRNIHSYACIRPVLSEAAVG